MGLSGKAAWFGLAALLACGGQDPDIRAADLVLRLPRVDDCQPTEEPTAIVVQALGDFPPSDENTIDVLRPSTEIQIIDRFPSDTEIIGVRVMAGSWTGIGARILGDESVMGPLLLVPEGRSCPLVALGDLLDEAQVTSLPNGGLIMVGGLEGSIGTPRILRVHAGEREGEVLAPELAMRFERVGHRLVNLGDQVLILGGALSLMDTALDEWETYDVTQQRVLENVGQMQSRRMHHAAARLADGRVVVAGGRAQGTGNATDTVEVIDVESGTSSEVTPLQVARSGHQMVTLDDGTTVIVGGFSNPGAFLPQPVVWDAGNEEFVQLDDIGLAVGLWREGFQLVPMEGARVVVVGDAVGEAPGGLRTAEAVVLRHPAGPDFGPPTLEKDNLNLQIPDLSNVRGAQLDDGRLLVTGRDASGNPRAFAFRIGVTNDAGQTIGEELEASPRVPDALVAMRDGLIMELAANGAAVRREGPLRTSLHNAGATVLGEDLSLDGPLRWGEQAGELVAQVFDARADVPTLRFADVAIELNVTDLDGGGVEVLLRPERGRPVAVFIRSDSAGPSPCEAERAEGAPVRIERRRNQLRIDAGSEVRTCTVAGLTGRIGVGFRAQDVDARLSGISVERL